jgi:hypothetical protein
MIEMMIREVTLKSVFFYLNMKQVLVRTTGLRKRLYFSNDFAKQNFDWARIGGSTIFTRNLKTTRNEKNF